jgi:hypothetical protein
MEYRFFDLLYVALLAILSLTSGSLMLYAIWTIGMRLMRALHVFLTCWDYRLEDYRFAKLLKGEADLLWDERLAALLTRDEFDFLYGTHAQPACA